MRKYFGMGARTTSDDVCWSVMSVTSSRIHGTIHHVIVLV
jgi:hypothetical protein